MTIDLFPTDALKAALDEPGSLIDDIDAAGRRAAAAFDAERGSNRERAQAFLHVIVADPYVPRATRKRLAKAMPVWWEAIVHRSRLGSLGTLVAELEAEELLEGDPAGASESAHPVLAYLNDVGVDAAARAFDAYRAALPPALMSPAPGTLLSTDALERATAAARGALLAALGARVAGDAFRWLEREAPAVLWTTIVVAAAGGLGSLIAAPKLVADRASDLGLPIPAFSEDVSVARFADGVKLRLGGTIRLAPGGLTDGPLWEQTLGAVLGGAVRVGLRLDDRFDLTAGVHWAPEDREWGVKLTLTFLRL